MDTYATKQTAEKSSQVVCQTSQGMEIRAALTRVTRYQVAFEIYGAQALLRTAEVLSDFKIVIDDNTVYSGRAVVSSLVNLGTTLVCEATLEDSWLDVDVFTLRPQTKKLRASYQQFFNQWQRAFKIQPEFKLLVGDLQMFLTDLRLWLEQVELGVRSTPAGDRRQLENDLVQELAQPVVPSLNALFEKFEHLAAGVPAEWRPVHHTYVKRQLHPLMLCAPFAWRTFTKPLGYAGDYEMVNMILRDPHEGASLFAKLLNVWFLLQPPAEAHRNRIDYLTQKLVEETVRAGTPSRPARVFNLGCGPAAEVQRFLRDQHVCERAHFTLLDFNEETLQHAQRALQEQKALHRRSTPIQLVKKSVVQLLKPGSKPVEGMPKYDYVYCAGLFDYLPDKVCKQLMNVFYEMLAPGGLLVVTNVEAANPIRHMLDYVLEWHLIYRDSRQMCDLRPDAAHPDQLRLCADVTGVNLILELRKPATP